MGIPQKKLNFNTWNDACEKSLSHGTLVAGAKRNFVAVDLSAYIFYCFIIKFSKF